MFAQWICALFVYFTWQMCNSIVYWQTLFDFPLIYLSYMLFNDEKCSFWCERERNFSCPIHSARRKWNWIFSMIIWSTSTANNFNLFFDGYCKINTLNSIKYVLLWVGEAMKRIYLINKPFFGNWKLNWKCTVLKWKKLNKQNSVKAGCRVLAEKKSVTMETLTG